MTLAGVALTVLVTCSSAFAQGKPASARPLFDVMPVAAWRVVGGSATFELVAPTDEVHGSTLHGSTLHGPSLHGPTLYGRGPIDRNGFFTSPRELGDFRLSVDVRLGSDATPDGAGMNSGIQIRSVERDGTVAGLQIEIDPSPRRWSGGVYDERGRGWLASLAGNDAAMAAFRPGAWNRYEIECVGPRIRTRVNGVACAEWFDATVSGVLAFQVHSGKACDVAFRAPILEEIGTHAWRAQVLAAEAPSGTRSTDSSTDASTNASTNAANWSRTIPAGARGVRIDGARGVRNVELFARDGTLLTCVAVGVHDAKAAAVSSASPDQRHLEPPRVIEVLWLEESGAVLVDGARVARLTLAAVPDRLTLSGAEVSLGAQAVLAPVVHIHTGGDVVDER